MLAGKIESRKLGCASAISNLDSEAAKHTIKLIPIQVLVSLSNCWTTVKDMNSEVSHPNRVELLVA